MLQVAVRAKAAGGPAVGAVAVAVVAVVEVASDVEAALYVSPPFPEMKYESILTWLGGSKD